MSDTTTGRTWVRFWRGESRIAKFAGYPGSRGRVRLRTLSNLRWLAIAGQSAALFVVRFGLDYRLPIVKCAIAIALSVLLNVALVVRYPATHRLTNREATFYLRRYYISRAEFKTRSL